MTLSIQQEIVEAEHGAVDWSKPKNDGYMRTCLELVGVTNRGRPMKSAELLALCRENGLPFGEARDDGVDENAR